VLGRVARDHEGLARLQALAWLFDDPAQAIQVRDRELSALTAADVADPARLSVARAGDAAMEVLRAACELERPFFERLPAREADRSGLSAALAERVPCAPRLATLQVACLRSLRLRGRVNRRVVWVGAPAAEPPLGVLYAVWQACHEATVAEVSTALPDVAERRVEHAALVLLALRAAEHGRAAEHAVWYAAFGGRAPGLDPALLPARVRDVVVSLGREAEPSTR
jgi:hypothetical protein